MNHIYNVSGFCTHMIPACKYMNNMCLVKSLLSTQNIICFVAAWLKANELYFNIQYSTFVKKKMRMHLVLCIRQEPILVGEDLSIYTMISYVLFTLHEYCVLQAH